MLCTQRSFFLMCHHQRKLTSRLGLWKNSLAKADVALHRPRDRVPRPHSYVVAVAMETQKHNRVDATAVDVLRRPFS